MREISSFFDKFKSILLAGTADRTVVSDAVYAVLGVKIDPKTVVIKDRVATIPSQNPVMRTELRIKKGRILEEIGRLSSGNRISDIR